MMPRAYVTADIRGNHDEIGIGALRGRGELLSVLHGMFARQPNTFALGLPSTSDSSGFRVFASTVDELARLTDALTGNSWIRDYGIIHTPRAVSPSFSGTWTSFVRFRIPTLKADRRTGDEHGRLRARRLHEASARSLDYFLLRSGSTSQSFALIIERRPGAAPTGDCEPNSYGFSTTTRIFSLPDVE